MSLRSRLCLKLLWLRHSYTFNWAHKPLCLRFERDVIRLGSMSVCRSCTFSCAGLLAGLSLFVLTPRPTTPVLVSFLATFAVTVALSVPPVYKALPRIVRDLLRASAGALLAAAFYLLLCVNLWTGAAALAVMFAFWRAYFAARRTRKLRACTGCPELAQPGICSGFARQADHVRQYEREATELLLGAGSVPSCVVSSRAPRS
jgi:hypothetical protein